MAARTLGRYRLSRVLGTGSFATVWLARDETLARQVAIKVLADNWARDPDVHRRFLSEARVLLDAESQRITRGYELGESADGAPYLVMAWADRGTLAERMTARRRAGETFAPHEAAAIGREIALSLADVHALGHLHRDLKPSNVLLRSAPAGDQPIAGLEPDEMVLLGDFGLTRSIDDSAITLVAGSPGYVAPEQAGGRVQLDARADLYSIGPILLELLTGDPGGRATTMSMASNERLDVRHTLAEHGIAAAAPFVAVLESLTAFDREARPTSAAEVADALERLASPTPHDSAPAPPSPRRHRSHRGRRAVVVTAAGAAVVGALAAGAALVDGRTEPPAGVATTTLSPGDLGLPPGAVLDVPASDEQRTVANVRMPVDDVVAFYRDPPRPWELDAGPSSSGDTVVLALTAGPTSVTVTVAPTAVTAGAGISRIVIDGG